MRAPWWQSWLLAERPGLRQFALAAAALLLPVPALLGGTDWMLPAMAAGLTLGVGLGLGWSLTVGPAWLRASPAAALGVLGVAFACLAHLELMPSWNLVLRAQAARDDFAAWQRGPGGDEPIYDCGPYRASLEVARGPGGVVAHTPEALQRWTPFGWRSAWFLLLRARGGEVVVETYDDAPAMERALAAPPPPAAAQAP